MAKAKKVLPFDELDLIPPLTARLSVSEDVQQTLSLLSAWDGSQRRLVRVSSGGVLYVAAPKVKDILNIAAADPVFDWAGDNIKTSDVLIRANPKNTGDVWVNVNAAAAVDDGYPLEAGEWINLTVLNLANLHVHFTVDLEKAIVVYSQ